MKAAFAMIILLAIGADCARIKRHRASGATKTEMEDHVTLIKSEEGERVDDRREKGEWIFGSSNEEAEVEANDTTQMIKEIVHAATWAINKSLQSQALIPKWNNLKLALNETKLATEKSSDAVVRLKDKLLEATVLFASSGLQNISKALKDGLSNTSLGGLLLQTHVTEKMPCMAMMCADDHRLERTGTDENGCPIERCVKDSDADPSVPHIHAPCPEIDCGVHGRVHLGGMDANGCPIVTCISRDKDGAKDFGEAVEIFKSTAIELSEIASSAATAVDVMKKAREIMDDVVKITDTDDILVNEMQVVDELQSQVETGLEALQGLSDKVVKHADEIKPIWDNLMNGAVEHGSNLTNVLTADMRGILVEFADEVQLLNELFTEVIEPFVPELIAAVRTVTDAVNNYALSLDAPEHVATEEMGRWTGCAWRSTRWFDNITDVDIDNTMTCEMEWFGRYRCHCIAFNDCYATEYWRPEPKELKRCFKQTGFGFR